MMNGFNKLVLIALLLPTAAFSKLKDEALFQKVFPYPRELIPRIDFWKQVFYLYGKNDLIIHDSRYPWIIYRVVNLSFVNDFKLSDAKKSGWRDLFSSRIRNEVTQTLQKLSRGPANDVLSDREQEILAQFNSIHERNKFGNAQNRIRAGFGMREEFLAAIRLSKHALPEIEAIFEKKNLPKELTRLVFVESMFRHDAESRKGALGIWQFMPTTGKQFLRVDEAIDERLDPVRASDGAGNFLKSLYEYFRSWPLAITAYNHGPEGVKRGIRAVVSYNLIDLIESYHSPSFGFASKNYYAEFLAALTVYENRELYFPELLDPKFSYEPRLVKFENVRLPREMRVKAFLAACGLSMGELQRLNPAIRPLAFSRNSILSEQMAIHIPPDRLVHCQTSLGANTILADTVLDPKSNSPKSF